MEEVEKGDFIKIEWSGRLASNNLLFDTTNAESAKNGNIYNEKIKYAPKLIVLGKSGILKGLEKALVGMKVGEEKRVEIPPEEGFGVKNPNLVRIVPLGKFKKQNINPYPGLEISLDGVGGRVKSVSGGRVVVDLNHPLAGERLIYELKVVERLLDINSKVKALMEDAGLEGKININEGNLEISLKGEKEPIFFANKLKLINGIEKFLPEIKIIRVIEEYKVKEEEVKKTE